MDENLLNILTVIMVFLIFFIFIAVLWYFYITYRNKNKSKEELRAIEKGKNSTEYVSPIQGNLTQESIYKFMEFEEIKDNMIIRKNRNQYVMVIQVQGVNYDLLSEQEKVAVEEGFVQFLNTLRFQIQLYIQTRSLNLKDIIDEYKEKVKKIEQEIEQIRAKKQAAINRGDTQEVDKLRYEERRKVNILEYGRDISEYIGRMSLNKNVLQQKTYIVLSYYVSELGNTSNYAKEEIDSMCFSELYTRAQNVIRSLASCEVTGRILNSEEIAELLYIAYNRDDSELMQLSKALDAQYDALYSTSRDVLKRKEELINKDIEEKAVELATKGIITADEEMEKERKEKEQFEKKVKQRALKIVDEYKGQMDEELYEKTVNIIKDEPKKEEIKKVEETKVQEPVKKGRGRPKKVVS